MNPRERPTPSHLETQKGIEGKIKDQTALQILFSFFILYHLSAIIILPNSSSYLGRSLGPYFLTYANISGLNVNWNFFSPDPPHRMFLRYVVRSEDVLGNETRPSVRGSIPSPTEQFTKDSSQRRYFYEMRFLFLDDHRRNRILGPWFCRQYPGATEVDISNVVEVIPDLDLAQMGVTENGEESTLMKFTYPCGNAMDDEASL